MIKRIEIHNIQSHENTVLELSKGINAIVGSSNNGKTAILRALNWARYNRPLGIDNLASHWIVDDKGNLTDKMSVIVENENGTVIRQRTKNENQYIVNDEILNVVKSDVPDEVERILNLTETNIQNQQDAPFLISKSSGEVAKYFNKVVRLDIIDRVLSNAESKRRSVNNDIGFTEKQIKDYENKLESFSWMDSVEKLLDKYERVEKKNSELREKVNALKESIMKHTELVDFVNKNDFSKVKKTIQEIESLSEDSCLLEEKIHNISNDIKFIENTKIYPDFSKEKKIIEKLLAYNPDRKHIEKVKDDVYMYGIQKMHIENSAGDIRCLKEQLPDICPLCGKPMDLCKGGNK